MIFLGHTLHPRYQSEDGKKIKESGSYSAEQVKRKGQLDRVLKVMS